jgi:hypothetical protein
VRCGLTLFSHGYDTIDTRSTHCHASMLDFRKHPFYDLGEYGQEEGRGCE